MERDKSLKPAGYVSRKLYGTKFFNATANDSNTDAQNHTSSILQALSVIIYHILAGGPMLPGSTQANHQMHHRPRDTMAVRPSTLVVSRWRILGVRSLGIRLRLIVAGFLAIRLVLIAVRMLALLTLRAVRSLGGIGLVLGWRTCAPVAAMLGMVMRRRIIRPGDTIWCMALVLRLLVLRVWLGPVTGPGNCRVRGIRCCLGCSGAMLGNGVRVM